MRILSTDGNTVTAAEFDGHRFDRRNSIRADGTDGQSFLGKIERDDSFVWAAASTRDGTLAIVEDVEASKGLEDHNRSFVPTDEAVILLDGMIDSRKVVLTPPVGVGGSLMSIAVVPDGGRLDVITRDGRLKWRDIYEMLSSGEIDLDADAIVYAPVTEDIVDELSPVTSLQRLDPDMLDGEDNPYVLNISR
ncbi:hypothetical protein [Bifidobacterium animalis]|uniref:hypothetical protein n=1 Tax=Bifidobacterium animalis TaxID=28025 RepID=UPI001BD000FA|nr:hypothetical protein [Bifidobacterium animalis]